MKHVLRIDMFVLPYADLNVVSEDRLPALDFGGCIRPSYLPLSKLRFEEAVQYSVQCIQQIGFFKIQCPFKERSYLYNPLISEVSSVGDQKGHDLGGGFKHFLFSPRKLGKDFTHFDLRIFFSWVETQPRNQWLRTPLSISSLGMMKLL